MTLITWIGFRAIHARLSQDVPFLAFFPNGWKRVKEETHVWLTFPRNLCPVAWSKKAIFLRILISWHCDVSLLTSCLHPKQFLYKFKAFLCLFLYVRLKQVICPLLQYVATYCMCSTCVACMQRKRGRSPFWIISKVCPDDESKAHDDKWMERKNN